VTLEEALDLVRLVAEVAPDRLDSYARWWLPVLPRKDARLSGLAYRNAKKVRPIGRGRLAREGEAGLDAALVRP
jgi:hypothetical protein